VQELELVQVLQYSGQLKKQEPDVVFNSYPELHVAHFEAFAESGV